jgi:hypothetical protein
MGRQLLDALSRRSCYLSGSPEPGSLSSSGEDASMINVAQPAPDDLLSIYAKGLTTDLGNPPKPKALSQFFDDVPAAYFGG